MPEEPLLSVLSTVGGVGDLASAVFGLCGGISGSSCMDGLRIDLGGGLEGAARD